MKKLYYLADVLTLCEIIAGVILLGMAILRITANCAIWVFVAGELCDAFDGVCARRWPYPADEQYHWWRIYVVQIEHLSDIFIALSCMIYLLRTDDSAIVSYALMLGVTIIVSCTCIEIVVQYAKCINLSEKTQKVISWTILIRRWCYAFIGIGGGVLLLIMSTSWPAFIKENAIITGICTGIALFVYKLDRALKP